MSREIAMACGSSATTMAPKKAPWIEPSPPMTIISSSWIEMIRLKVSLLKMPAKWPISAPARPVMAVEMPKAVALVRATLTPIACAETSESRTAAKERPSGERRMLR